MQPQDNCRSGIRVNAIVFTLFVVLATEAVAGAPPLPGYGATTTTFTNSTPVALPDLSTVTSTITVSGVDPLLWDVDLTTFITHTWAQDQVITLTSPEGTVVSITTNNGGGNDDVFNGTLWDDDAGDTTDPGAVTDHTFSDGVVATPLAPEEALGAFMWEDPNGDWTLTVTDVFGGDSGTLSQWSLDITTIASSPTVVTSVFTGVGGALADPGTVTFSVMVGDPRGLVGDVNLSTSITHTWCWDLIITLTSPEGTVVTVTSNNGGSNDNVYNGTLWDDDAGDTTDPGPVTDHAYADNVVATPLVPEEAMGAFIGEDPIGEWTLSITDVLGPADTGQLTDWSLELTLVNRPPAANPDTATTSEDSLLQAPSSGAPGVLDNDVDPDGDAVTVAAFDGTSAMGALVTVNADGSYSYDPRNAAALQALGDGESAVDTFSYTASDPFGLTEDGTVSVTVNGAAEIYALTTGVSGNGTIDPAPGTHQYPEGTIVDVFAAPETGWAFTGWQGDATGTSIPASILMDGDKTVTAVFGQQLPSALLTISVFGGGTTTPAPGEHAFLSGSDIQVTAVPSPGWAFAGWSGDVTSTNNPLAFTIYADTNVTANFIQTGFACPFPQAGAASPASPSSDMLLLALVAAALLAIGRVRRQRKAYLVQRGF